MYEGHSIIEDTNSFRTVGILVMTFDQLFE